MDRYLRWRFSLSMSDLLNPWKASSDPRMLHHARRVRIHWKILTLNPSRLLKVYLLTTLGCSLCSAQVFSFLYICYSAFWTRNTSITCLPHTFLSLDAPPSQKSAYLLPKSPSLSVFSSTSKSIRSLLASKENVYDVLHMLDTLNVALMPKLCFTNRFIQC